MRVARLHQAAMSGAAVEVVYIHPMAERNQN